MATGAIAAGAAYIASRQPPVTTQCDVLFETPEEEAATRATGAERPKSAGRSRWHAGGAGASSGKGSGERGARAARG